MAASGTSSPNEVEKHTAEIDLFNVLPGLATVPEETDITDADRRSYMSFESWDTSFSAVKEGEYTSTAPEPDLALPGIPNNEPLRRIPTSIGDIHVPANLLRIVSSTKTWRPSLELPDDNGLTAQDIITPQISSPTAMRGRVQSVTLGQLGRTTTSQSENAPLPDSSIRNLRKSSVPIGQELNRTPALPHDAGQPWTTMHSAGRTALGRANSLSPVATRRPTTNSRPTLQTQYTSNSDISPAVSARDFASHSRPVVARSASFARRNLAFFSFGRRTSGQPAERNTVVDVELGPDEPAPQQTARPSVIEMMPEVIQVLAGGVATAANAVAEAVRRPTLVDAYERAKIRTIQLQRKPWVMKLFEYSVYLLLICFVYFVLIGVPLWNGAVWWLWWVVDHKFVISGGWAITIGLAVFYAFGPLLILFEPDPPFPDESIPLVERTSAARETALLIPCYKSAKLIGATLTAALKIFPAENVFVIANGNSPTPLDNTEEVCRPFEVNHVWSPVGSKIVAQFVGCYAAKDFKYVLMIDDDCALPANFPIVTDRMKGKVMCMGYTIKSVGPESSKGTLCQQAQDLEYKLSGIQRAFAGKLGSCTFAHGAIGLWDRDFLIKVFYKHPGFSVSEDWFFGHAARQLGCRILMTTSIFVETETPGALFFAPRGGARGGFGEMTVFKQRFSRWNFFFSSGLYWNFEYILLDWKLGFWELGAKLFVFQEIYETILYLLSPFILPISFVVRPAFCAYLFAATFGLYIINVLIFNELHLRRKHERIGWKCVWLYYMPYKFILTAVNIASCYWSLYKYATYFAKRHPKIVESGKAIEVVLRLQEDGSTTAPSNETPGNALAPAGASGRSAKPSIAASGGGRRMTVTALDGAAIRRMTAGSIGAGGEIGSMTRDGSIIAEEKEHELEIESPPAPVARELRMSAIGEVDVLDVDGTPEDAQPLGAPGLSVGELAGTNERRRSGFREFMTIAPLTKSESIEEEDEESSGGSDGEKPVMSAPNVAIA